MFFYDFVFGRNFIHDMKSKKLIVLRWQVNLAQVSWSRSECLKCKYTSLFLSELGGPNVDVKWLIKIFVEY